MFTVSEVKHTNPITYSVKDLIGEPVKGTFINKILRKSFEGSLSKRKISNVFNSQEMLQSPLIAIEKYSGVRNGEIRADFYDDCQNIPDQSAWTLHKRICCCWTTVS